MGDWTLPKAPVSRLIEKRNRDLNEDRVATFDWGLFNVIRTHFSGALPSVALIDGRGYQLYEVNAFSLTPDLWLDFQVHPSNETCYRLQSKRRSPTACGRDSTAVDRRLIHLCRR